MNQIDITFDTVHVITHPVAYWMNFQTQHKSSFNRRLSEGLFIGNHNKRSAKYSLAAHKRHNIHPVQCVCTLTHSRYKVFDTDISGNQGDWMTSSLPGGN